ncbi:ExbD/TolR family protein [Sulfitobacter sp. EhC04]|uniref:ExbD/TolR family protein n=1 Tax=Sulfitobacter sp. EhC04 TaxID=1849168 RepID=UPI0009EE3DBD|nr:biopolymer transporter ExbD [Sulfitobacter sp. EhC04]
MRKARQRRALSMTSLIDVIFLLLLFFMLTSTFTRFAEVEFASAGAGSAASSQKPVFVSLAADSLRLNGDTLALPDLSGALAPHRADNTPLGVLVAARADVTAQRLTDLLGALRSIPDLTVTVLEPS